MTAELTQPEWCNNQECFPRKCINGELCFGKLPIPIEKKTHRMCMFEDGNVISVEVEGAELELLTKKIKEKN